MCCPSSALHSSLCHLWPKPKPSPTSSMRTLAPMPTIWWTMRRRANVNHMSTSSMVALPSSTWSLPTRKTFSNSVDLKNCKISGMMFTLYCPEIRICYAKDVCSTERKELCALLRETHMRLIDVKSSLKREKESRKWSRIRRSLKTFQLRTRCMRLGWNNRLILQVSAKTTSK